MKKTTSTKEYRKVIKHFRGIPPLAEALGITPQAIYMWKGKIPKSRVFEIRCIVADELVTSDIVTERRK